MRLQGTVEHSQASLRHQTQGRVRTGRLGLWRHRIAQGRTGPALQERVGMGRRGRGDLCGTQYSVLVGEDRQREGFVEMRNWQLRGGRSASTSPRAYLVGWLAPCPRHLLRCKVPAESHKQIGRRTCTTSTAHITGTTFHSGIGE